MHAREGSGAGAVRDIVLWLSLLLCTGAFEAEEVRRGSAGPRGANERLAQLAQGTLPEAYMRGLRLCKWPGRGQVRRAGDGGKGVDSMPRVRFLAFICVP